MSRAQQDVLAVDMISEDMIEDMIHADASVPALYP